MSLLAGGKRGSGPSTCPSGKVLAWLLLPREFSSANFYTFENLLARWDEVNYYGMECCVVQVQQGHWLHPAKAFCDLNCLATTTEMLTSCQWHSQATGSGVTWGRRQTQVQLKVWGCREKVYKGVLLPAVLGYGASFLQIVRLENLQCIVWLSHVGFLTKSVLPNQLNLEERNMLFSFQLKCLISSEKKKSHRSVMTLTNLSRTW